MNKPIFCYTTETQGRCVICYKIGQRKATHHKCRTYNKFVHSGDCYAKLHNKNQKNNTCNSNSEISIVSISGLNDSLMSESNKDCIKGVSSGIENVDDLEHNHINIEYDPLFTFSQTMDQEENLEYFQQSVCSENSTEDENMCSGIVGENMSNGFFD